MEENTTKDKYQQLQPQTPPQYPKIIDVKETIETICHLSPNSLYSSSSSHSSKQNTGLHNTTEQVKCPYKLFLYHFKVCFYSWDN